jgi:hypothetical protein
LRTIFLGMEDGLSTVTGAERQSRYRAKRKQARREAGLSVHTPAERAQRHRQEHDRRKRRTADRPFVGVDGEGCGTDELGRQHYMLMRAGDRELYTGQPLTTVQCLEFICDCPSEPILVGFAFGYDVTQMLRDLSSERRARLLADKPAGQGFARYTWFDDYGIEYLPKNYLRVCRSRPIRVMHKGEWTVSRQSIPGTARTIYDTFGFFQASFLKAIKSWDCGTIEQREQIERNKAARAEFAGIDDEVRRYCALECNLLAEMMEKFRTVCIEADIRPRTWNGAGKLSAALHKQHETIPAARLAETLPSDLLPVASAAYYGGRFEVTRVGDIAGPIFEYDIKSAYPDQMRRLPCLEHGSWEPASGKMLASLPPGSIYVARVRFRHDADGRGPGPLCGLPVRLKTGRLTWPAEGNGTYWSVEIDAARKLGMIPTFRDGWRYVRQCDCHPFGWVEPLFEYRKSLGGSTRGYPIKLGTNGLYGKLAQRVGNPKWSNLVWAGLITAGTRAKLIDAAAHDPDAVCMLATDGIFSRRPLPLSIGESLGDWEAAQHARLFVVQPGIYWGASKPKTRGVSAGFFADKTDIFEAAWRDYAETDRAALGISKIPSVPLPLKLFIGLRLAQARGKPETAGRWTESVRNFNFDWHGKRGRHAWETATCIHTRPLPGAADLVSCPHAGDKRLIESLDLEKMEVEDMPDYLDLTPPWRD